MMKWWRGVRLRGLQRQLAMLRAEMATEREFERLTGECFPTVRAKHARDLAGLEFDIAAIAEADAEAMRKRWSAAAQH